MCGTVSVFAEIRCEFAGFSCDSPSVSLRG